MGSYVLAPHKFGLMKGPWRNGSAPDFGSGGSGFESLRPHVFFFWSRTEETSSRRLVGSFNTETSCPGVKVALRLLLRALDDRDQRALRARAIQERVGHQVGGARRVVGG